MATCPNSLVGQQCPQVTPARACSSVILYIWMPTSSLLKKKNLRHGACPEWSRKKDQRRVKGWAGGGDCLGRGMIHVFALGSSSKVIAEDCGSRVPWVRVVATPSLKCRQTC